jgi:hypothetical protein
VPQCARTREGGDVPPSQRDVGAGPVAHQAASRSSRSAWSKSSWRAKTCISSCCGANTSTSSRAMRTRSTPLSALTDARSSRS